ncbi:myosin [Theileria orientalis]|uniref:Myosin-A n=1 Tax=Theileria orientalis TaxID=68886 RepID=A0A976MA91_THEOR|nr:myosin [Theileria orientalis]
MVPDPVSPIGATKLVAKRKGEHFTKLESKVQNVEYLAGGRVWVKTDDDEMFVECTVKSVEGENLLVNLRGNEEVVNLKDCLNSLPDFDSLAVNDLAKIPHANSAVVLKILRDRFSEDKIYVYAGKLLVALNPFKKIENLYDDFVIERYKKVDTSLGFPVDLEPHTYAVGQCAINGLFKNNKNQSCIVSGESGAGKTETAKQLMNYFAYSKSNTNKSTKVQDIVLGSNALLESFGNAKTINNNNSSRFGKFLKLNLLPEGGIVGGVMSSYMLEISRVEFQNENERNFHLFYQVLRGLSRTELDSYGFMEMKDYHYLNQSKCYEVPGIDDVKDFGRVLSQLNKLFEPDLLANFFQIISGILLCGNVEFEEESRLGVDSAAKISNESLFRKLTELFGLEYTATEKAIVEKVIRIQENTIESAVTPTVAQVNIRALSKDLYGFLFKYIIELLNEFTSSEAKAGPEGGKADQQGFVGILDIYGFEYFKYNTYEQLLINYANEKLQKYFINNVFTSELSLYESEKIDVSSIVYSDNSVILEIFEKKNCGIFPFLYEQCVIESGSSEAFTRSCNTRIKNDFYLPPKGNVNEFTIVHTACKVIYNTDEFISKNKHSLSEVMVSLLMESNNKLLKDMVTHSVLTELAEMTAAEEQGGRASRVSRATKSGTKLFVGNKFIKSINELIACLEETDSHFVRCVKTNQLKQSNYFDVKGVYGQLNSLSILEAIQIIHKGYAYKSPFKEFIKDNQFVYNLLVGDKGPSSEGTSPSDESASDKENALKMVKLLEIPENEYQIGLTRIFLKKNGWILLEQSHLKFSQLLAPLSNMLSKYYYSYVNRVAYFRRLQMVERFQSLARKYALVGDKFKKVALVNDLVGLVVLLNWLNLDQKTLAAVVLIQSMYRMKVQRNKYLSELEELRKESRRRVARNRLAKFKSYMWFCVFGLYLQRLYRVSQVTKAATKIQAAWRMHRCIAAYNHLRYRTLKDYAATVVQKNVRCYLQVKNYEFMRYVEPSVVLIQSHFRGWLVRRFVDSRVEVFKWIRNRLNLYNKVYMLQNVVRTILTVQRFKTLKEDLLTLQSYFWTRCWYVEMIRIMWASNTIKRYWNKYKFRKLRCNGKDELLDDVYKKKVQQISRDEIVTSLSLLQNYKSGLLPVHVNVSTKLDEFYPNGWSNTLSMILKVNGDKSVSSISMGSFHTVVVLNESFVYAYGLNDYNQLGYNIESDSSRNPNNVNVRLEPIIMIREGLKVKQMECGLEHTVMLLDDGSTYTWGLNRNGQCGQMKQYEVITTPTLVTFNNRSPVRRISSGNYHVCCLNYDDELFVWGKAFHLGLTGEDLFKPAKLNTPFNLKSVYAGKQVTYLLDRKSNLYSFGTTYNGQLGYPVSEQNQQQEKEWNKRGVNYTESQNGLRPENNAIFYKFVASHIVDVSVGNNLTVALDVYGNLLQWGTFLVVNPETETFEKKVEYTPFIVSVDKQQLKSPVAKVSVGWWEVNLLTESLNLYGYNYLKMEKVNGESDGREQNDTHRRNEWNYKPMLFSYQGLTGINPKDVKTLSSPTITVTMIKKS